MTGYVPHADCKHCGLSLTGDGSGYYLHAEGPQRGKMTCAINPYGFNAEPAGTECERICNGARGISPNPITPPETSGL